ncbi:MAG TPA: HTH domain-containing protein [Terracidiphilus sp.]|nr:HTH domain-containing protein [Terracidiphilus sp.]
MKKGKVTITTGTVDEFFGHVRSRATKLDRGESIAPEVTITFEDPLEMLNVLTSERVRLLRRAKAGAVPISDLASSLKRDVRAVSRDVSRLEKAGLLRTTYRINPGHGRHKVVEPVAREYNLTASL